MNCNKVEKLVDMKKRTLDCSYVYGMWRVKEHLLLPQNLCDSVQGFGHSLLFHVHGSVHRLSILIIVQRDAAQGSLFLSLQVHSTCSLYWHIYLYIYIYQWSEYIESIHNGMPSFKLSLWMFRVSITPIIRSTQNCNYSLRYWSYFLCSYLPPTWPS